MARIPRFALVERDSSNHCTWRAHDSEHVLEEAGARDKFLELLGRYKGKYGVEINSYCLMGTHPHVMCTTRRDQEQFSRFWQVVNGQFARWYNKRRDRRGQVVMERMRSPCIQAEGAHKLMVMRYGDLNPVRAGRAKSPKEWKWSSYRHYAFGEPDPLIDDAPEYLALGKNGPPAPEGLSGAVRAATLGVVADEADRLGRAPVRRRRPLGDASPRRGRAVSAGLTAFVCPEMRRTLPVPGRPGARRSILWFASHGRKKAAVLRLAPSAADDRRLALRSGALRQAVSGALANARPTGAASSC